MWTTSHNKKVIIIEFLLYLCTHTALLSWLYSCAKFLVENGCSAPWLEGLDCEKQLCADQYSPQNPRIVQNIELHSLWNIKTSLWVNLGHFCWRYEHNLKPLLSLFHDSHAKEIVFKQKRQIFIHNEKGEVSLFKLLFILWRCLSGFANIFVAVPIFKSAYTFIDLLCLRYKPV